MNLGKQHIVILQMENNVKNIVEELIVKKEIL